MDLHRHSKPAIDFPEMLTPMGDFLCPLVRQLVNKQSYNGVNGLLRIVYASFKNSRQKFKNRLQSTMQLSCHLSSVKQQSLKLLYRKVLEIVQQMEFIPTITILFG